MVFPELVFFEIHNGNLRTVRMAKNLDFEKIDVFRDQDET